MKAFPPGRLEKVEGRGEIFVRDSGPGTDARGTVLLLHGWMFGSDLNWATCYAPLQQAGYRVVAIDHRGHGRGLRTGEPFRLADCADDAAALVRHLDTGPVLVVGYSMGGAIAQLVARRHPDIVSGLVLCATTDQWRDNWRMRLAWRGLRPMGFYLRHQPRRFWEGVLRGNRGSRGSDWAMRDWTLLELLRGEEREITEAGREMARFDSRPWIGELRVPTVVIRMIRDELVPPGFQVSLAEHIPGARRIDVDGTHVVVGLEPHKFVPALLEALADVQGRAGDAAVPAAAAS